MKFLTMLVSSFNLLQSFNYTPYLFYKKLFKSEINSFCIWIVSRYNMNGRDLILKYREVKLDFAERERWMQTGSSEPLIGWKSGKKHLCCSLGPNGESSGRERGYGLWQPLQCTNFVRNVFPSPWLHLHKVISRGGANRRLSAFILPCLP